jgi:glycosyltransferase involved in cell wall biosynthesis
MKTKIAIIGTNGIPAKYGGFETLVEFLAEYLSNEFDITVYCSSKFQDDKVKSYKGVNLCYINLSANGWQSILFDFLSLSYSYKKFDKVLILGCSGSLFQPFFRSFKHKFIMNLGGLDWQRSKWNYLTRLYLKVSERLGVKFSGQIVSDNEGIKDYILSEYAISSSVIAYGGDQVFKVLPEQDDCDKYKFLEKPYAFTVARIQPDNNIELLCNSFNEGSLFPLVIVGNWNNSSYGIEIKKKYQNKVNLELLDAIYDQRDLNLIRSNCFIYLHGHSAGGTNPALVEAMNLELPIIAFDNVFNRYTTKGRAKYFTDTISLQSIIKTINANELKQNAADMYAIAKSEYYWSLICEKYSEVFKK